MSEHFILVCDRCGHIEAADRLPEVYDCQFCPSTSAWSFALSKRDEAEAHAANITRRYQDALTA